MNSWAITDKGIVRRQNQDAYFAYCNDDKKFALLLVCDGMGGAKAGNIASETATEVFMNTVKEGYAEDHSCAELENLMQKAILAANETVYEMSLASDEYSGMGTTLVAAIITRDHAVVLNVGDSRAYHIAEREIKQITKDHSFVEDLIDRGDISREEAQHHPNKNLITRALGTCPEIACDIFSVDMHSGEYLLLCTDGLTNELEDYEILYEVNHAQSLEECCEKLLQITIARGAPDNVTIVLFQK